MADSAYTATKIEILTSLLSPPSRKIKIISQVGSKAVLHKPTHTFSHISPNFYRGGGQKRKMWP